MGGSPCTFWSISQSPDKREVTNEGMGWELFQNYVIAKEKFNPDFFLYENNESISKLIQSEIEKSLGVNLLHINSATLSAQTRHRIYGTDIQVDSTLEDRNIKVKDILDYGFHKENLISEVKFNNRDDTKDNNKLVRIGTIGKGGQGERVYSINGKSCTLSANGGGRGAKTGLYLIDNEVRKLNPLEAERLQTMPDNYTLCDGVPETQRYKCIGNGWTAEIIIWILSHIDIPKDYPIEVLSMYDGIATGRYVLEKLGYSNITYKAYEIDKYAIKVAMKNYPDIIQCGDAFKVREEDWRY
ncbi:MAG: DNA cytosine methyltransferase [Lachnospiraceae bacterium]|nr:DNA cytosine methyltransferase [Lachnospiraceae bacterium]